MNLFNPHPVRMVPQRAENLQGAFQCLEQQFKLIFTQTQKYFMLSHTDQQGLLKSQASERLLETKYKFVL